MNSFSTATDVAREVAKQTESIILEQLNDFIKRGLIEIESGPISFVDENPFEGHKITIRQSVRLRLKDREYIERLESENKIMREALKFYTYEQTGEITYLEFMSTDMGFCAHSAL